VKQKGGARVVHPQGMDYATVVVDFPSWFSVGGLVRGGEFVGGYGQEPLNQEFGRGCRSGLPCDPT
jgi:hypothetical protein